MTMKSVYIVYITNCFLWTLSDNKTYIIIIVVQKSHACIIVKDENVKVALFVTCRHEHISLGNN